LARGVKEMGVKQGLGVILHQTKMIMEISTHKTNLICTGLYTQQMHKISSSMFRHSMGAIIMESAQRLK